MAQVDYRDPEWAAEQLGLEKNTIYRWLRDGTLPGLLIGRRWLISESQLRQFLEEKARHQTHLRRILASKKSPGQKIMDLAVEAARVYRHDWIGQEHLLIGLVQLGDETAAALAACGANEEQLRTSIESVLDPGETPTKSKPRMTPVARKAVDTAERQAERRGEKGFSSADLVNAMFALSEGMGFDLLHGLGVDEQRFADAAQTTPGREAV